MLRPSVALAVLLAAAAPLAAQTLFVQDSFTDSNNTQLQNHTPNIGGAWSHVIGTAPLQIENNALTTSGNSTGDVYMNAAAPPAAEYVVGVTITFARPDPNNYVELYGRGSPAATGYGVHVDAQGGWEIDRYNGGVVTVLASGTTAVVNGAGTNDVEFSIKNAVKTLVVNGTTLGTTTDNTITTAGTVGLGLDTKKNDQSIADDYFASTFAPTAVRMESMSATSGTSATAIEWTTGRESENLGFRVWRSGGAEGGRRVLLTPSILAGSAFLTAHGTGSRYRWIDAHPAAGSVYWIEEIDLHGKREWHGPVVPARGLATGKASATLATISETGADPHPALRHPPRANAADGTKIVVDREGWYRVPVTDTHVHLVADGAEVPISVEDGAILFYGTPRDTTWSGTREYFVVNGETGARIRTARSVSDATPAPRTFDAVAERRDRTVFFGTLRNGDGDSFFGPIVTSDGATQTLALHHLDLTSSGTATVTIALQGGTDSPHRILVAINGHAAPADVRIDGQQHAVADIAIPSAWLAEGDNTVTLTAANRGDDVSVIDFVRIAYPHTWTADGDALVFTAPGGTRVTLAGFSGALHALDVTGVPVELQVHGNSVDIPGSGPHRVIATTRYDAPASIAQRDPIALHGQSADIVMITAPALRDALEPLRALRAAQGNRVLVVTAEQVFDQYSFGAKDPAAIRRFLADVRPRSVLLAGEGTLDPRNYLGVGGDFVPVKLIVTSDMKTASDAWFTDFDDDGVADIPIGRLPASSAAEMKIAVDRIVSYETAPPAGAWSRSVVTVTSDADFHDAAASVQALVPPSLSVHAIDGAAGATAARADLLGTLTDGALLVDYLGHGSVDIWRSSSFFGTADALALANGGRTPAVIAMTCLNGYFQDVYQTSLARTLLNAPKGGAVAVWALSTLTDPRGQQPANEAIATATFAGQTLGEATVLAQRKTNDSDVRRTLLLFGDPETKLKN